MEINNTVTHKTYKESIQDIDMGLDVNNTDSIMTLLRNSIYSNPLESFVREIYSNAIDAHLKSGVTTPIEVKLVEDTEQRLYYFIVRDFGNSMTIEDFKNVYAKMGTSTKTSSNTEMGGFGLGAKSPLAYTNQFFIDTWTEEENKLIHREWVQYIDSSQIGKISLLKEEPFTGKTGTQIRIPIELKDYTNIVEAINNYLSYSILPFEVEGFDFKDIRPTLNITGEDWGMVLNKEKYYYSLAPSVASTIVVAGIPYRINKRALRSKFESTDYTFLIRSSLKNKDSIKNDLELFNSFLVSSWHISYVLLADIGSVDLSASREDLQYTEKTCCLLYKKLFKMFQEYCSHLMIDYVNNPSYFKACYNFTIECPTVIRENVVSKLRWAKEDLEFNDRPFFFKTGWGNEIKKYEIVERGSTWNNNLKKVLTSSKIARVSLDYDTKNYLFILQDTDYKNYTRFLKDYLLRVKDDSYKIFVVDEEDVPNLCSWVIESADFIKLSDIVENYKVWSSNNTTSTTAKRDTSVFNAYIYKRYEARSRADGYGSYFEAKKAPCEPEEENYYVTNDEMYSLKEFGIELQGFGYYSNFAEYLNNYLDSKNIDSSNVWFVNKPSRNFSHDNWISLAEVIKDDFNSINKNELKEYSYTLFMSQAIPSIGLVFSKVKCAEDDTTSRYSKLYNKFINILKDVKTNKPDFHSVALLTNRAYRHLENTRGSNDFTSERDLDLVSDLVDVDNKNLKAYKDFMKDYPLLNLIDRYTNLSGCSSCDNYRTYIKAMGLLLQDQDKQITFEPEPKGESDFNKMINYFS